MKRKLLILLTVGTVIFTSSCEKIKEATKQNVTLTSAAVTLTVAPSVVSANVIQLSSETSTSSLDALIKEKASGFGINNVKSLKIKTLKAEIISGSDATNSFANLESIAAKIEATGKTPFTGSYTSASTAKTDVIDFVVDNSIDVKDLITSSGLKYTLSAKVRTALTKQLTVKVTATYDVVLSL